MIDLEEQAFPASQRLLSDKSVAVLSSSDHGHPHSTLAFFAVSPDFRTVVFFIDRAHLTYRNVKADGRVCLLIDTRDEVFEDVDRWEALRVKGVAWEVKNGGEYDKLREWYLDRHPARREFVDDAGTSMFKVSIDSAHYVRGLDQSLELQF